MKPNLAILLLLLPIAAPLVAKETAPASDRHHATEQSEADTPAAILAEQVKEIAASSTMSLKTQAKLIANAVKTAISAAIEGIKDPAERLNVAMDLATVAAKAAPEFAATITSAVSTIPSIAKIEGAQEQIQSAVKAGLDARDQPDLANPATNPARSGQHEFGGPNRGEHIVSPSH